MFLDANHDANHNPHPNRDLDRNHDKHVTSVEWEEYIRKRPNLKWLVTRLQSVRR